MGYCLCVHWCRSELCRAHCLPALPWCDRGGLLPRGLLPRKLQWPYHSNVQVSTFYTKRQMALRTGILYSGSQLGNAVGGLFALGILQLDGAHGVEGWRWLFIVEGAMTVGLAIVFGTFIPNRPETCRWITPIERERLIYRLALDRMTKDNSSEVTTKQAFKLAVTDPKVWFVAIALTVNFVASAVTNCECPSLSFSDRQSSPSSSLLSVTTARSLLHSLHLHTSSASSSSPSWVGIRTRLKSVPSTLSVLSQSPSLPTSWPSRQPRLLLDTLR